MSPKSFSTFAKATIAAVFLLIAVGGIVRATGSGMGCPDWPKCFGRWIPPTTLEELPVNYAEIYGEKLKGEVVFNPIKTWIEYLNRLLGVLIGLLIFGTFLFSIITFWKSNRKVVRYSLIAFVLVVFEGWLGSKVVSTELLPWTITLHLLVAIAVVLVLIFALHISNPRDLYKVEGQASIFLIWMALGFGQFVLGTRIREKNDLLEQIGVERMEWINSLGGVYWFHLVFATLLVLIIIWSYIRLEDSSKVNKMVKWSVALVITNYLSGFIFHFLGIVAWNQPIHLLMASLFLGTTFISYLQLKNQ